MIRCNDVYKSFSGKMQIETIHSSEPNLETVFLELTGRKSEEDEICATV